MKPTQPTIYELGNTANADVHTGDYENLTKTLYGIAKRFTPRPPHQTEAAHLHRCAQAAYPLALRITIKTAQKDEK